LSILTVTDFDADKPDPFVATQATVVPAVSDVRVVTPQPEDEEMLDSGSLRRPRFVSAASRSHGTKGSTGGERDVKDETDDYRA
jgi:hypothetical protein